MPGKTGKRSKKAAPCAQCGTEIKGDFMRAKEGDFHETCWWKRFYPDSKHAKA